MNCALLQGQLLSIKTARAARSESDTHGHTHFTSNSLLLNTLKALPPHRQREETGSDSTMALDRPGAHVRTVRKGDGEVADIKTGEVAEEFKCQP